MAWTLERIWSIQLVCGPAGGVARAGTSSCFSSADTLDGLAGGLELLCGFPLLFLPLVASLVAAELFSDGFSIPPVA